MSVYNLALFVHMLGLIALFGAMIQFQRAGARLRRTTATAEARVLAELIASCPPWFGAGAVLLLASGIYMVATTYHRPPGWVLVGLGGLVLAGVVGARAGGRQIGAVQRALGTSGAGLSAEALAAIHNRAPWVVLTATHGLGIGIVLVMSLKPTLLVSLTLVAAGAVAGAFAGASLRGTASAAGAREPAEREPAPEPASHG